MQSTVKIGSLLCKREFRNAIARQDWPAYREWRGLYLKAVKEGR